MARSLFDPVGGPRHAAPFALEEHGARDADQINVGVEPVGDALHDPHCHCNRRELGVKSYLGFEHFETGGVRARMILNLCDQLPHDFECVMKKKKGGCSRDASSVGEAFGFLVGIGRMAFPNPLSYRVVAREREELRYVRPQLDREALRGLRLSKYCVHTVAKLLNVNRRADLIPQRRCAQRHRRL